LEGLREEEIAYTYQVWESGSDFEYFMVSFLPGDSITTDTLAEFVGTDELKLTVI